MRIKKNGKKVGKQLYKCHDCNRQFVETKKVDSQILIKEYIDEKLTLNQLSKKYGVCVRTIWSKLKDMRPVHVISQYKDVVVCIDTTYWGRGFGLMIIQDCYRNKILWHKFVRNESVADYVEGIEWLRSQGFKIYGIVCDGIRGLFKAFRAYRVQMCQFHMIQIVRRHLTTKPDLIASCELLTITHLLTKISEEEFRNTLKEWYQKWHSFLMEKSLGPDGKMHFKHARTRASYSALKYYMPWLWTFMHYPGLIIPNTNSSIESLNQRLKTLVRNHSGISKERRKKLLEEFIATHY